MRNISLIVVHCADTPANMDVTAEMIRSWHKDKGWSDIGYHLVIKRDGTLEEGRPMEQDGAHAYGYNKDSIGICLAGGRGKDGQAQANFTVAQWKCLFALHEDYSKRYPQARWTGHNTLSDKPCPTFDVEALFS